jgi:putative SOS response-associated peptidase YedK
VRWNLRGDFSFEPRYNIAPSQSVPVIVKGEQSNEVAISLVRLSCEARASLSLPLFLRQNFG